MSNPKPYKPPDDDQNIKRNLPIFLHKLTHQQQQNPNESLLKPPTKSSLSHASIFFFHQYSNTLSTKMTHNYLFQKYVSPSSTHTQTRIHSVLINYATSFGTLQTV